MNIDNNMDAIKNKSFHWNPSIMHFNIEILKRLPACPIEDIEIYWKKNLEYIIFENDHIDIVILLSNSDSLIFPLNRNKNVQSRIRMSKMILDMLSTYDVVSKDTSA